MSTDQLQRTSLMQTRLTIIENLKSILNRFRWGGHGPDQILIGKLEHINLLCDKEYTSQYNEVIALKKSKEEADELLNNVMTENAKQLKERDDTIAALMTKLRTKDQVIQQYRYEIGQIKAAFIQIDNITEKHLLGLHGDE